MACSSLAVILAILSSLLLTGSTHECPIASASATKSNQRTVFEELCCEEANYGKALKIKKSTSLQFVVCPKESPRICEANQQSNDGMMSRIDCKDWYEAGYTSNGVYSVNPDGNGPFDVYCDMTTSGGGWTVFQKRMDGSVSFYQDWEHYKNGFGELEDGEFWLGLEYIHRLTKNTTHSHTLRVDLWDHDNVTAHANYTDFRLGNESTEYTLILGDYSGGEAGDSLTYHNNLKFTTKDNNNDADVNNCAIHWLGAWWFGACYNSHLNGLYLGQRQITWLGIIWYSWKGNSYSLEATEMKFRRD